MAEVCYNQVVSIITPVKIITSQRTNLSTFIGSITSPSSRCRSSESIDLQPELHVPASNAEV